MAKKVAHIAAGDVAVSHAPKVTAIQSSGGNVVVHIKVGNSSKVVSEPTSNERAKLHKFFSDDLVKVILSETSIPRQKRSQTLDRIASQYKNRIVAQREKKKTTPATGRGGTGVATQVIESI